MNEANYANEKYGLGISKARKLFGRQLRYLWHRRLCHSLVRSVFMASFWFFN